MAFEERLQIDALEFLDDTCLGHLEWHIKGNGPERTCGRKRRSKELIQLQLAAVGHGAGVFNHIA